MVDGLPPLPVEEDGNCTPDPVEDRGGAVFGTELGTLLEALSGTLLGIWIGVTDFPSADLPPRARPSSS